MTITMRGGAPLTATGTGVVSVTATGASQPQTGDRLIIVHGNDFYALSNMSTPTVGGSSSGVTTITGATADAGSNQAHCKGWYFDVGSTGDLTIAMVETGSADEDKIAVVYVLAGCDLGTAPVGNSNEDHSFANVTVRIANGVTPSGTDDFLIIHTNDGGGSSSAPYAPPGGMSETYDTSSGGSMGAAGATEQLSSGAATGTRTWTVANTITAYGALTIAVKTDAGAAVAALSGAQALPPHLLLQLAARNQAMWQNAGATTYLQDVSGSITGTAALVRQPAKVLAGTSTGSGSLVRLTSKNTLAGSLTATSALAVIKAVLRSLAGTITAAGNLVRQDNKVLSGTSTATGSVVRQTNKRPAGSISGAGSLATVKAVLRTLTGSITATGAVSRRTGKALSSLVTPAGAVLKLVSYLLGGAITPTGAVANEDPNAGPPIPGALSSTVAGSALGATSGTSTRSGSTTSSLHSSIGP